MSEEQAERLGGLAVFATLAGDVVAEVAASSTTRRLSGGEVLARAGDDTDDVYVVLDGALEAVGEGVLPGSPVLAEHGTGSVVGEVAALTGRRRSATLRAARDTEVLSIPAEAFGQLLDAAPELGQTLAVEARRRLDATRLVRQLRALFPGVDVAAFGDPDAVAWQRLEGGEVLFRQDDAADAAYLLVAGRLRVVVEAEGDAEAVAEIGAGELVGEMALLEGDRRTATVVAARDSVLATFPRAVFDALVLREPAAMLEVTRTVLARTRDPMDPYERGRAGEMSVCLLPLDVDCGDLATELATRMAPHGDVAHVSSRAADAALGEGTAQAEPGTPEELRLTHWLDDLEDRHRVVLHEADPDATAWTRRSVRGSDHLVLVADAGADPGLTALERAVCAPRDGVPHQRVSLVLLHEPDAERAAGTAAWLAARDVDLHHHVRRGSGEDLDRLARHVAGRAVGLVFGGGGARGFAQLGVVRALHEAGVPVDTVAGTSIGATLAALVAIPVPLDELVPTTGRFFEAVLDYNLPIAGLVKGRRTADAIARATDGRALEDFWLPYLCTATNLTRARLEVLSRGDPVQAIRASLSIPGVFPPVPYGEDLLVDGGVLDNLPVRALRSRHPTATIIAVDVAPPRGPRAREDYGVAVSGGSVLWRRLVPGLRPPAVPGLAATLLRSMITGAVAARDHDVEAGLADLYLPLDLRGVGMLEFHRSADVAERGYEAAREPIHDWLRARAAD